MTLSFAGRLHFVPPSVFANVARAKASPIDRTAAFAALCRINALYMIAQAGSGHIGSSFSSLDIVSWLLCNEVRGGGRNDGDTYFSSKGHDVPGLYAALTGLGVLEFDLLHRLRRLGGLPGHPDVETPGIAANTGSLGMGIAKAKGMVHADRMAGIARTIYVLLGDGELQEGQNWESLPGAVNARMGEIIAIVDRNKIQSDTWVSKVLDLGDLPARFASHGWHVQSCNGHDLAALQSAIARAKAETARPSVIIADTVKGRGVSFMEWGEAQKDEPLYPFHSGAPSPENYERALTELVAHAQACLRAIGAGDCVLEARDRTAPAANPKAEKLIEAYAHALVEQAKRNPKIVSMDADLVLDTGQIPFRTAFPERFLECGIAEQDMISQASGLALRGYLPIVHSFACFLTTRPNEQIYNNVSERTKIVYVGSLAGVVPGGPGHSHQSVRDIAALSGMPGLTMLEPSCAQEVPLALDYAVNANPRSTYLRLVSIPVVIPYQLPTDHRLEVGRGTVLADGEGVVLFAYGPVLTAQAYLARERLRERHGVTAKVVALPWLNRVDAGWLKATVGRSRHIVTLDNHYLAGGQGALIATTLAEQGALGDRRVTRLGLTDLPACGRNDEVLAAHGLDADGIVATVVSLTEHVSA